MIQKALDAVPAPGAVLLKAGEYRVGGKISINRNGVVLRGEGEATRIVATGTTQRTLMNMGVSTVRRLLAETAIVENALAGQMWVRVDDPSVFAVGDRVSVCLAPNDLWISDLKMDRIQGDSEQWEASYFLMYWDREVTRLEGDKVWLDCPIVMDLEARYEMGKVSEKEAYQELSKYIRHFVHDVTGIRVQNYTLEDIGRLNMPMLYYLIAECYAPEFSADASGNLGESIRKAREVIYGWN